MSLAESSHGASPANGGLVRLDGRDVLRIAHYDRMAPFLMTIPSDTDLWMFLSSAGGLTAGRRDPDGALFPYVTEDWLHDAHHTTGPITLVRLARGGARPVLWQPFDAGADDPAIERHLYKAPLGTPVVFEERHAGHRLTLRAEWAACDAFGHVRTVTLANDGAAPVTLEVLDGLRNLLPFGAPLALYQHSSSLVDAYKQSEVDEASGLGVFALTARISDRPEPAEELRANVAWLSGLPGARLTLSPGAVGAFRRGEAVRGETRLQGRRGNLFAAATLTLAPGDRATWRFCLDAGRDQSQVAALRARLLDTADTGGAIGRALDASAANLRRFVADADGLQQTADARASVHHLANVLYNGMRGGFFADGHRVPGGDVAAFVRARNAPLAARHAAWLDALPAALPFGDLLARAAGTGDPGIERLAHEYLPLHFGRRHGDPSRPWNRFAIRVRGADGAPALHYEGNWRDIFQNWEALAASSPAFLPGLIAKFLNASTVDGFNPYRITRDGIDWEVEEPGHPWSNIGYWGDHPVVYLLRLLEALRDHEPGALVRLLDRPIFAYADVPYRIVPFERMIEDPRATIAFDHERAARVAARVRGVGADGKLAARADGGVLHVTLFEKLLVTALARLSNVVPGAGVWMNTQRPEWNDANNALVGYGASVVTLAHLARLLEFLGTLFEARRDESFDVSREVAQWAREVGDAWRAHGGAALADPHARFALLEALGRAYSRYRAAAYANGLGDPVPFGAEQARALVHEAREHVERSLESNVREDGLLHAYNVLVFDRARRMVGIERLPVMLEGQVAALGSGRMDFTASLRLLDGLFASELYREDRDSFQLYPERTLPSFLAKNVLPKARVQASRALGALIEAGDRTLVVRDAAGAVRFAPDLRGEPDVRAALDRLAARPALGAVVAAERDAILALYEEVFRHHAFTGRSGTMFAYEGIGSVYWHMVAKLLLAVQETHARSLRAGAPAETTAALARHYARIRAGLGFEKSAEDYGAFPTDPYSHTPAGRGAQQPGMTGQVKEEILTRFGELGVEVRAGLVSFRPRLLSRSEFFAAPSSFECLDSAGAPRSIELPAGSLAFTFCGTPVRYALTEGAASVRVRWRDGRVTERATDSLDGPESGALLGRLDAIALVEVGVPSGALRTSEPDGLPQMRGTSGDK